ncbi:NAD(P)H-dependent oxidoreductase [Schaalia hyovaginalis]|uniref:NADPH-dependent FMN reductase n=2 Tax=Schaalia TaxID=2529408 RepID=UPI002A81DF57|nr:NAD(P)H-dependent oxidoreductase [Schaalia hyovaginalis]MDY4492523.1 NAD(P)H-dependent oxidoreductase [Schaalia hyovaginalis]
MVRLAVLLGSVRPNAAGAPIARWVVEKARSIDGVEAELVDLKSFDLPLFAEAVPPASALPRDPKGAAFNAALCEFDAFIIVTPEYNHSIPGALKNALDFLAPATLAHKGIGFVGYSYTGGVRPIEHLRQILANFEAGAVRPQLTLSLINDFSGKDFTPAAHQDGELEALVKAVVERSAVLAPLR